jgi:hypothetical protein
LIDQKKKDCEKDVGRVEVILPAVDQKKKDCEKDIGRVEMMEGQSSKTKRAAFNDRRDFLDVVLSWSLENIYDENLYKNQV